MEFPQGSSMNGSSGVLNFAFLSEKKRNLLLHLRDGSNTLDEIKSSLGVTSKGITSELRKMEEAQLICQTDKMYALTEIGMVTATYMYHFEENMRFFGENTAFWNRHKISAIPEEFLFRLHEFGNHGRAQAGLSTSCDEYMKSLKSAKWMKVVSAALYPLNPEYVFDLVKNGVHVSIISPGELVEEMTEKYRQDVKRGMESKKLCISACDGKLDVDFTVTDSFISLRPFLKDGVCDLFQNIMSFEKSAVRWGEDLFNFYEKRSRRVELQDL